MTSLGADQVPCVTSASDEWHFPALSTVLGASARLVLFNPFSSDAGIDVVGSEYATVAAEQTAVERLSQVLADQIVARLGLFASRQPAR